MSQLELLILGGLLGMVGQIARVVVGAKKVSDRAVENNTSFKEEFDSRQLVTSLVYGFAIGVFALMTLTDMAAATTKLGNEMMAGIMAAGYSGTDFIEGFVKKHFPPAKPAAVQTKPEPVPAPSGDDAVATPLAMG